MRLSSSKLIAILLHCLVFCDTAANPIPEYSDNDSYNQTLASRQAKVALRIMPLGASITQGAASVPLNGYRKGLRDQMRFLGHEVNMVGSAQDGNFNDNQHEGHPGAVIGEMQSSGYANSAVRFKPNVITILVGSNDCARASKAGDRTFHIGKTKEMENLLNFLYDNIAGVTIVLATLPPTGAVPEYPDVNDYVYLLNSGYRSLVGRFKAAGKRIQLAEMNNGFYNVQNDGNGLDILHPNNAGYAKLAAVFATAIQKIESSIVKPIDTGIPDKGTGVCPPSANLFNGPVQTQRGSGVDDGSYKHAQTDMGRLLSTIIVLPNNQPHDKQMMFAQLVNNANAPRGGEADDLVFVLDRPQQNYLSNAGYGWVNLKINGHWDDPWIVVNLDYCEPTGIRWGDFNNDGLDDYICLAPNGDMSVQINRGGNPPTFGASTMVKASGGKAQSAIRLGDIDGDGRLDWCYLAANQDLYCERNGGQGDGVDYWQDFAAGNGPTFNTKNWPELTGIRLVDVNGDFKSDVVYVFGDGATAIWINQRGTAADGPGLKPAWIQADSTHPPSNVGRDAVKFARIYASGRADYIKLETQVRTITSAISTYAGTWSVQKNTGCCGKNLRGDGVRYCDMYGRGHDDYIWIWSDGKVTVYENINNPPFWDPHEFVVDVKMPRKHVHFADWNGDGKCDVLTVDQNSGEVRVWINTYNGVGNVPTFAAPVVAVAAPACNQRDGVGLYDQAARFADVDGDGRADFLCMEKNGRTSGWLSQAGGAKNIGQVKLGLALDRANLKYVDMNGDGRADLVWQDKMTGDVQIYNNNGMIPSSGSAFNWAAPVAGTWKKGMDRSANLFFAKMSNSGKIDYVQNLPKTNVAYVWYNQCPGGGSLDDGPIVDPRLPVAPPAEDGGGSIICPRAVKCGEFPRKQRFIGMGDSYAAGIGAGNHLETGLSMSKYDPKGICFLGQNAYSMQLLNVPELSTQSLEWMSCTSAKVKDVIQYQFEQEKPQRDTLQYDYLAKLNRDDYSVIMMSMGGNDVDFGGIAKWCLILPPHDPSPEDEFVGGNCGKKMDAAQRAVGSGRYLGQETQETTNLKARLTQMYRKILDQPTDDDSMLIVTGYARFFNQEDQSATPNQDCAKKTMTHLQDLSFFNPYVHKGYLTVDFRREINEAVEAMNRVIQNVVNVINEGYKSQMSSRRAHFVDIDHGAEGHRFCDKRPDGTLLDFKEEVYIHLPFATDITEGQNGIPILMPRDDPIGPDSAGTITQGGLQPGDCSNTQDLMANWRCWLLQYGLSPSDINADLYPEMAATVKPRNEVTQWASYKVMKAFHPKSIMHSRTTKRIRDSLAEWQKDRPCGCEP